MPVDGYFSGITAQLIENRFILKRRTAVQARLALGIVEAPVIGVAADRFRGL